MRTNGLTTSLVAGVTLVAAVVIGSPADAQWFGDVAIGTAFTHTGDVNSTPAGSRTTTFLDVKYDKSFEIAGRAGYWFEPIHVQRTPINLGLGLNVFRFSPDITSQAVPFLGGFTDIDVTAVSLDLMARFPKIGQLRPYATVGPAIFWSTIKDTNFSNASATDTSWGLKLGLGVAYTIRPHVDLFGEYRYTHFAIDAKTITNATGGTDRLEMDINTSHLLVGLGFRF